MIPLSVRSKGRRWPCYRAGEGWEQRRAARAARLRREEDRAKQAGKLGFHNPHQLLQYFPKRSITRYHLQNTALCVTQRLYALAFGHVHHRSDELDAARFIA